MAFESAYRDSARRNPKVLEDGARLFRHLGLPADRGDGFVDEKTGRWLTDDIIAAVAKVPTGRRKRVIGELRGYLREHAVLPMSASANQFLPPRFLAPRGNDILKECYVLFDAFLKFEVFAISEWGLGRPVLFPAVPALEFTVNGRIHRVYESLNLADYAYPMLVDHEAPGWSLDAYFVAFALHQNLSAWRRGERPSAWKETKKGSRLPSPDRLELALRVYDHFNRIQGKRMSEEGKLRDALEKAERDTGRVSPEHESIDARAKNAKRLYDQAKHWVSSYRLII